MTLEDGHWAQIATWQQLQDLANDLVFYEVQGIDIKPSSPRIGADGGWDGRYTGRLFGKSGIHMVQSKHHQTTASRASDALRNEIPEEITKAIARGAQHLIIFTNAEMTVQQADELEAIEHTGLQTLTVIYRARLKRHIERHPGLMFAHFGVGVLSYLHIPEDYFTKFETHLSAISFQEESINRIAETVATVPEPLRLIHGLGGNGKSHLLRAIAKRLAIAERTVVRVISGNRASLADDVSEDIRLAHGERVVLLLDDAERKSMSLVQEIARLVHAHPQYSAILTCRTPAVDAYSNLLTLGGDMPAPIVNNIALLTEDDLLALVRRLAPTRCPEEHIVKAAISHYQKNTYLIQLWAEAIESGGLSREELGRASSKIIERLIASCRPVLQGIVGNDVIPRLLSAISAATPLRPDNDDTVRSIATIAAISSEQATRAIERLESSHVLRRMSGTLRFAPDMFGDLIFAKAIEDQAFRRLIIEHFLSSNATGLATSLAAAKALGGTETSGQIAVQIVNEWLHEEPIREWWNGRQRFSDLAQIAILAPTQALSLARKHVEVAGGLHDPRDDESRRRLLGALGNINNVLLVLGRNGLLREEILDLLREVAFVLELEDRKKVSEIVERLFRPLHNPIEKVTEDLRRIALSVCRVHDETLDWLAVSTCSEILQATHEDNFGDSRTFTLRSRGLPDHPQVRSVRATALSAVEALLTRGNYAAAIKIASEIAGTSGPLPTASTDTFPLAQVFENERDQVLQWISRFNLESWRKSDLHELEDLCIRWWARQSGGELAKDLLSRIPTTPEYRLFRRLATQLVVEDYAHVFANAPQDRRWNWLFDGYYHVGTDRPADDLPAQQSVAQSLSELYVTANALSDFLRQISDDLHRVTPTAYGDTTLERWVALTPQLFSDATDTPGWQHVSDALRARIDATLSRVHPPMLPDLSARVVRDSGGNVSTIYRFLTGLVGARPDIQTYAETLLVIARNADPNVRAGLLRTFWQVRGGEAAELRDRLVRECLPRGYSRGLANAIVWLYNRRSTESRDAIPADVWEILLEGLIREPSLSHDDSETFHRCSENHADDFTRFLDARIQLREALEGEAKREYHTIPNDFGVWPSDEVWSAGTADAYIKMIARNEGKLAEYFGVWHVLEPISTADKVPPQIVASLIRALTGTEDDLRRVSVDILMNTNANHPIDEVDLLTACAWMVEHNLRDKAREWLRRWNNGTFTRVGGDGVTEGMNSTIALLRRLKARATPRLKTVIGEVLSELEQDADQMRAREQDEGPFGG